MIRNFMKVKYFLRIFLDGFKLGAAWFESASYIARILTDLFLPMNFHKCNCTLRNRQIKSIFTKNNLVFSFKKCFKLKREYYAFFTKFFFWGGALLE